MDQLFEPAIDFIEAMSMTALYRLASPKAGLPQAGTMIASADTPRIRICLAFMLPSYQAVEEV